MSPPGASLVSRMNSKKPRQNNHKQKAAEIAADEVIKTQAAAAKYVHKSTRTIRRWEGAGMLTATQDGQKVYIKSQLDLFLLNEGRKQSEHRTRREISEADLKQARAELTQMELDEKKGLLVYRADAESDNIKKIHAVKRALMGLSRKLARQLAPISDPRKIKSIIDKETRKIIEGFSR